MTTPESPASLLRRAADSVDATAAETSAEPWATPHVRAVLVPWVALMSIDLAPHLSAWLRGHADYIEGVQCSAAPESLAFARSILGEAETA